LILNFYEYINEGILFENSDIILQRVNINDKLNEGFISLNYNYNQYKYKKTNLRINDYFKSKYKEIEKDIKNYLNDILPFTGEHLYKNIKFKYNYDIIPTYHWILKFYRKEFEDPNNIKGYINPNIHEGIDLIYNNADVMTKYISTYIKKISNNDENYCSLLIRTKDNSKYSEIVSIEKEFKKNNFNIKLISQIKGVYYMDEYINVLKLHPNGSLKKLNSI